ncbi:hypothetical protein HEP86_35265 [Streptomyces sp. RPA4-5]|uniref:barstar family protein n=1 Tax=Streptomyces sp. RPA4-5 TaxID=2721245 RepID=UPI00143E7291|nr:barstar family protein [Streptomyces sp. RPA4-5]QIY58776.1 hypothetical protein HEP86_35265 [Streptomyces sp. RPA4-5]
MRTSGRGGAGQKYALASDEDDADFWGCAREAEGLFTPLPGEAGARRVRLAGCLPQGGLLNFDALDDCLRGGLGATPPFTLHWDSSAEASARLVERVPTGEGDVALFDLLKEVFEERGVSVMLR